MESVNYLLGKIVDGGRFFVESFDLFFSLEPLKFIPALLLIFCFFGSITAILGLIGSGISATSNAVSSSQKSNKTNNSNNRKKSK